MTKNVNPVKEQENPKLDTNPSQVMSSVRSVEEGDYAIVTNLNPLEVHKPFDFVVKFEELRKAFLKYAQCEDDCTWWHTGECTCGLDALLDKYDY